MFLFAGRAAIWLLPALLFGLVACAPAEPQTPAFDPTTAIDEARQHGQPLQALYLLEAQASASGWTPALARQAGDLWQLAGDPGRALDFWQLAATDDRSNLALLRRLALGYIELQRWAEAADTLEQLAALAPDDAWTQLQLGLIRAAFDADAARLHLRAALAEPAYQPVALALLNALRDGDSLPDGMAAGLMLASLEQWPYAELAFRHAAVIAAPYPQALAYTALARDRQGKAATAWMDEALQLAPDDAPVRYLQGLHLRAVGDYPGSLDALAQAVALDPENPAYQAELASAYRLLGDLRYAEYWLESAVRVSNQDPRFSELLALFYADEAENLTGEGIDALAQMAAALEESDADVQAGLGWALFAAGRHDEALAAFEAALALDAGNARALYYKGRALLETGDAEAAAPLLRQVSEGNSAFAAQAGALLADAGI